MPAPSQVPVLGYKFEPNNRLIITVNRTLCKQPCSVDRATLADYVLRRDGAELLQMVYDLSPHVEKAYVHLMQVGVRLDDWSQRYHVVGIAARLLCDWLGLDEFELLFDYDQVGPLPLWATQHRPLPADEFTFGFPYPV